MLACESDSHLELRWSSKLAELGDSSEGVSGGEEADRSENPPCVCSVNFSVLQETLLRGSTGCGRPECGAPRHVPPPPRSIAPPCPTADLPDEHAERQKVAESSVRSRACGGRGGSRTMSGMRYPLTPASGAEEGVGLREGAGFGLPPVETDSFVSPKCEIKYVPVDGEIPFLYKWMSPDVYGTAQDPLSVKQETDAGADDSLSIHGLQSIKQEVVTDLGLSGCIKADPDFSLAADTPENWPNHLDLDKPPGVFKVNCTNLAARASPQCGVDCCTADAPILDMKSSTNDSVKLTITSSNNETYSQETTADGATDGSGEKQCSSDTYTRPQYYCVELIAMAIKHSPQRRATQAEIWAYITGRFPYYRRSEGWQKLIVSQLLSNKCFVKQPKGHKCRSNYWTLDQRYEYLFENGIYQRQQHRKLPFSRDRVGADTYPTRRRATLVEICTYIAGRFPYYRQCREGWQKSISNQLSRSKCFVKQPKERRTQRCYYWTLDQQYEDYFQNVIRQRKQREKLPFDTPCPQPT